LQLRSRDWIETGHKFANIEPVNGTKVCDVSEAGEAMVRRAVDAARAAMKRRLGRLNAADQNDIALMRDEVPA
jgi:acyl-CoA reductase-like NAD-dependent aldehyde dehydrogenase